MALLVEAQDVVAHATGAAALHLVLVAEELLPSKASAVIQLAMGEDTQEGALPCIYIPHYCHSETETERERERERETE